MATQDLTVAQAAARLKCSARSVRNYCYAGLLAHVRPEKGRSGYRQRGRPPLRIPAAALKTFVPPVMGRPRSVVERAG